MSDKPTSRRQFLKGLGMVTGAFATGAFALNSSANEEGVVYNETPSGIPCFYIFVTKDYSGFIPNPGTNPNLTGEHLYHVEFEYYTVCKGQLGPREMSCNLGNFANETIGRAEKSKKIQSLTEAGKVYCGC